MRHEVPHGHLVWVYPSKTVRPAPTPSNQKPGPSNLDKGSSPLTITRHADSLPKACPSFDQRQPRILSLVEATHPGPFDRADAHEDILAAIIRLDKSVALLPIEPLHGSLRHVACLSGNAHPKSAPRLNRKEGAISFHHSLLRQMRQALAQRIKDLGYGVYNAAAA
jgi:hypothetical protein